MLCVHWLTSICTVLFLVILPVHSSQLHLLFKTSEMKGLFDQVPCMAKLVSFPIPMACRTAASRVVGLTSLPVTGTEHASVYTCVPTTERELPECAVTDSSEEPQSLGPSLLPEATAGFSPTPLNLCNEILNGGTFMITDERSYTHIKLAVCVVFK